LTAAVAGVSGSSFFGTLMMIAGAFVGDDDDPEEMLRKWVAETARDTAIGYGVAGMIMDGIPGYFTGTSLTNRVGMADMWFRSSNRESDTWGDWVKNQIVPIGILEQLGRGVEDIKEGNVTRGVEKILPAALRNVTKAGRYATEGVLDKQGNPIVENVPLQDLLKQVIGFTPAEIADRYARNNYQYNTQKRIKSKATEARQGVARAMIKGDKAAEEKAQKQIDAFNARYPDYEIRPKSVIQSMRAMEKRSGRMEYGVDLDPKLADRVKAGTAPSIYAR
jgi:hypothetical protein